MRKGQPHTPEARAKISAARRASSAEPLAKAKVAAGMDEIGASGLVQYDGRVAEELHRDLSGYRATKVYREMTDNDPVVGAILFAVDMLARQVDWRVEPSDAHDEAAAEAAEFVESCLNDMSSSWEETLSSILSMLPFGWSYHEVVYKRRSGIEAEVASKFSDGRIGWRKLPIRAQDTLVRWDFDDNGGVRGLFQQAPPRYEEVFIPIEKALLFRTSSQKGNPEGRSVLRNAYRPWYFKKRIEEIEAIGIERDLTGLPVAWVPSSVLSPTASAAEQAMLAEMKRIVRNVKRDEQEGLVWPLAYDDRGNKKYDITLLTTGGRRQFDTDAIIARYEQRIAMTVIADFILLGHEKVGSKALGVSKVDLFTSALEAWLDGISGVFNSHAIPRLLQVNGMDVTKAPTLAHGRLQQVDLAALGEFIAKLAGAGAPLFPDDNLEGYVRDVAGLPARNDSEEV